MFVLPNLFTLSSVFCGLLAITKAIEGGNANLQTACLSIFFGLFFDMADGRVARLTKTQSDFGVQIDSLADTITFGVARHRGLGVGALEFRRHRSIYSVYISELWSHPVGALQRNGRQKCWPRRILSWNSDSAGCGSDNQPSSLRLRNHGRLFGSQLYIGLVVAVSLLMVSNVRYRSFKRRHGVFLGLQF